VENNLKLKLFIFLCLISFNKDLFSQNFDKYFKNNTLRINYYHCGKQNNEKIYINDYYVDTTWSGPKNNLIYPFIYGDYFVKVYDTISNEVIYSYGFCTLFREYQTTLEAKSIEKCFRETIKIPFPKSTVKIELLSRDSLGKFNVIYESNFNPKKEIIKTENLSKIKSYPVYSSGKYNEKLDITFISEGYTKDNIKEYNKYVKNISAKLLQAMPFSENKNDINIWSVEAISEENGSDFMYGYNNKVVNTALNSNFYTFGTDRYVTTEDYWSVAKYASVVPSDIVCVIVNSDVYGGGGIFNFYAIYSANADYDFVVLIHEIGHLIAGLADEYYTSETAYVNFYPLNIEPWSSNITTMVDFKSKWADMLEKNTPIPTPANYNKIGAYEGGGYSPKGIYRSMLKCYMKDLNAKGFCPVCEKTIVDLIKYYSDKK